MSNFIVLVEKRHCENEGGGYLQCTWWGEVQKRFINYCKPKKIHEPEILHIQKNTWHQNFLHKITSILIYSIKQTLLMYAFVTVNKLIILVCPFMSLHPPLWSTFTHRSSLCEPPKVRVFLLDLKKYIIDLMTTKKKYRGWKFSSEKIHQAPPVMYCQ